MFSLSFCRERHALELAFFLTESNAENWVNVGFCVVVTQSRWIVSTLSATVECLPLIYLKYFY